jgi:arylsulfatase A-like enzyme
LLAAVAAFAQAPNTKKGASSKPNSLLILVDNIVWGDYAVYGGMTPAPRIDRLAAEPTLR